MRPTARATIPWLRTKRPERANRPIEYSKTRSHRPGFLLTQIPQNDFLVHHDLHAIPRLDRGAGIQAVENAKALGGPVDALHAMRQ